MTRIGVLNTIPEAPVKPLMQEALEMCADAKLINPPPERLDGTPGNGFAAWDPENFDIVIHDGDWPNMSDFSQYFIRTALAGGALIRIVNGRKGEK